MHLCNRNCTGRGEGEVERDTIIVIRNIKLKYEIITLQFYDLWHVLFSLLGADSVCVTLLGGYGIPRQLNIYVFIGRSRYVTYDGHLTPSHRSLWAIKDIKCATIPLISLTKCIAHAIFDDDCKSDLTSCRWTGHKMG